MGYTRSSAALVMTAYVAIAVFGTVLLPHSSAGAGADCIDGPLMHGECPHALAAAALHHLAALHSLADMLVVSAFFVLSLLVLLVVVVRARAPKSPTQKGADFLKRRVRPRLSSAVARYIIRLLRSPGARARALYSYVLPICKTNLIFPQHSPSPHLSLS